MALLEATMQTVAESGQQVLQRLGAPVVPAAAEAGAATPVPQGDAQRA